MTSKTDQDFRKFKVLKGPKKYAFRQGVEDYLAGRRRNNVTVISGQHITDKDYGVLPGGEPG